MTWFPENFFQASSFLRGNFYPLIIVQNKKLKITYPEQVLYAAPSVVIEKKYTNDILGVVFYL
jgi:hypothetical protein